MLDTIPWGVVIGNLTGATIGGLAVLMVLTGKLATTGHLKVLIDQIADKTKTIQDQSATINEQRDMLASLVKTTQTIEKVGSVVEHTMTTISDQKAGE